MVATPSRLSAAARRVRLDPAQPIPTGATSSERIRLDLYVTASEFRGLSAHGQATFAVLYSYTRADDPTAWPAVDTIAAIRGVCRRRLQLDLAELVEAGLVARTWRYVAVEGQTSTLYRLLVPPSLRVTGDELPLDVAPDPEPDPDAPTWRDEPDPFDGADELDDDEPDLDDPYRALYREPVEAEPVEAEPVEAEPVEAEPVEAELVEAELEPPPPVHRYAPPPCTTVHPKLLTGTREDGEGEYPRPPGSGAPARPVDKGRGPELGTRGGDEQPYRVRRDRAGAIAWLVDLLSRFVLDDGPPPAAWAEPRWSDVDALTVRIRGGRVRLTTGDVQTWPGAPDRPDGLRRRDVRAAMVRVSELWRSPELAPLVDELREVTP